uniref:Odorant-binding protein 19 n=1 Tax=Ectropis obliqua TaxID=248899 RepID=A0A1L2BLC5_ECTOB|nr:odorant-binding protein 19 [Ectropis obliqua]
MKDQISVINSTDYDYDGYGSGSMGEKFVNSMPKAADGRYYPYANGTNRTRRSEPLFSKPDNEQCLSQCVFANLQVVDSRGIPREAELWNKIQSSVTSQQSRAALKDQTSACFQELQSEAEDNGCSYSNKLERCLMLRFSDRKPSGTQTNNKQGTK